MQRGDYLQTAGAQSRKRRVGGVLLRTCHISGGVCGGGGAGGAERGKTGIHRHNGQNFLQQLLATSQALFLQDGAQKELAGGVVSLFPM